MRAIVEHFAVFWFNRRIALLHRGMDPAQVQRILGDPDQVEQAAIPVESAVGLQDCFAYKLSPGDPYLQWQYKRGDRNYYLWFARPSDEGGWRLSWNVSWPAIVDAAT